MFLSPLHPHPFTFCQDDKKRACVITEQLNQSWTIFLQVSHFVTKTTIINLYLFKSVQSSFLLLAAHSILNGHTESKLFDLWKFLSDSSSFTQKVLSRPQLSPKPIASLLKLFQFSKALDLLKGSSKALRSTSDSCSILYTSLKNLQPSNSIWGEQEENELHSRWPATRSLCSHEHPWHQGPQTMKDKPNNNLP